MTAPTSSSALPDIVTAGSLGPWPGNDPVEAAKVQLGLFTGQHLPTLSELPARGVGSDAVGRTAALLQELPVDVQPYGWRFVDRPGHDQRRAVSALSTDVNVLADVAGAAELHPEALKLQLVGPFSLAAAVHLHYGERAVRDVGARRDIAQSLAAGLVVHAAKLHAALPGAALTLHLDEPDAARVLAGTIPTASGYRTLRAVPAAELRQLWTELVAAARTAGFAEVVLNLAAPGGAAPTPEAQQAERHAWRSVLNLALECGVDGVALTLARLDTGHWERLAEALEAGAGVWAGTVPVRGGQPPAPYATLADRVLVPWRALGLPPALLGRLRITPETGLAGLTPQEARTVSQRTLEVADALTELRHS